MTYLQRATKDGNQKQPFYYAVPDKCDALGFYSTLCVGLIPKSEEIQMRDLTRGFFEPYIKITEKEFLAAKAVAQHILDSFGTEKNL